ncbi:SAM-dependent methyltransferase [Actinoallomurus acanthiterrae]
MADRRHSDASSQWFQRYGSAVPEEVDLSRPSPARVYDRLLGGKDNFAVDRAVVDEMVKAVPDVMSGPRMIRACLGRVTRFMAAEVGIDQFIDLGSGLPTRDNVHEIARRHEPDARVVYVDNDPVVLAHGRAILAKDQVTAVITADLRDIDGVLDHPDTRRLIDFRRPVGLIMCMVLQYVPGDEDRKKIVAAYRDRLAPGSHLFLSYVCRVADQSNREIERIFRESLGATLLPREEIEEFFTGWKPVEPGLVPLSLWRPDGPLAYEPDDIPVGHSVLVGGVARKE